MNKSVIFLLVVIGFLQSCFDPKLDSPEKLLQHYIYLAFSGTNEAELEKYLTPELLQKIKVEQTTNPTNARKLSFKDLKLKNYKMVNKLCEQENSCQLRFEVGYEEINSKTNKVDFQTDTRKIAVIKMNENKEWKIDEIDHLRTYHDIKTQIDVPLTE